MGDTVHGPEARADTVPSGLGRMGTRQVDSDLARTRLLANFLKARSNRMEQGLEHPVGPTEAMFQARSQVEDLFMAQDEELSARERLRNAIDFQKSDVGQMLSSVGSLIEPDPFPTDPTFLRERESQTNQDVRTAVDDLPLIRRILAEDPSNLRTLLRANALHRRGLTGRESTFSEADRLFETIGGF